MNCKIIHVTGSKGVLQIVTFGRIMVDTHFDRIMVESHFGHIVVDI